MCETQGWREELKVKQKTRVEKALKQTKLNTYTLNQNMHGYSILPHKEKLEKSMAKTHRCDRNSSINGFSTRNQVKKISWRVSRSASSEQITELREDDVYK